MANPSLKVTNGLVLGSGRSGGESARRLSQDSHGVLLRVKRVAIYVYAPHKV
jgi:hypothetical protein